MAVVLSATSLTLRLTPAAWRTAVMVAGLTDTAASSLTVRGIGATRFLATSATEIPTALPT